VSRLLPTCSEVKQLNVTEIDELLTSLNGISFPDEWDGGLLCMPANRKVVEGWFYKHHERLREIERKTENIIAGESFGVPHRIHARRDRGACGI